MVDGIPAFMRYRGAFLSVFCRKRTVTVNPQSVRSEVAKMYTLIILCPVADDVIHKPTTSLGTGACQCSKRAGESSVIVFPVVGRVSQDLQAAILSLATEQALFSCACMCARDGFFTHVLYYILGVVWVL